ncbi:MAG: DUF3524 domain-containing protein [Phycisphaerae bacterium]|nr:DUF3524 domain-containing protein [Phycisphaerae bacterium]
MTTPLNILTLEAYDGGSHGQFLDGLISHSAHNYMRIGMPPRKWKWRMRGSALYFIEKINELTDEQLEAIDLIFTSDMTSVADLKAMLPEPLRKCPVVCYFHENQLTYPVQFEDERDFQYAFTNITTALAADYVWFNSNYHRQDFLDAVEALLKRMPDCVPGDIPEKINARSMVMPLGLPDDLDYQKPNRTVNEMPILLWNHRWEHDKNPDDFFEALFDLDRTGIDFKVIIAGQRFRESPDIFEAGRLRLANKIIHFGYAENREHYLELLRQADIVVSTSIHEFFGLSVLEALACGCLAILPKRLSYPELIPAELHGQIFYNNANQLRRKLLALCKDLPDANEKLIEAAKQYSWSNMASKYDLQFSKIHQCSAL